MNPTKPKPEEIAAEIVAGLERGADPVRAAGARRYFREQVEFYGLTTADMRTLAQEVAGRIRPAWSLDEALALAEILLPKKKYEAKAAAIVLLLTFKKDFTTAVARRIKAWLAKDYCDNWAAVDILCPEALGGLIERFPALADEIHEWTGHRNRWVRRASIVAYVPLARHGKFLDQAYRTAEAMFGTEDDLLQKATGWMLREAGKKDMPRLRRFLLDNGPRIPRTTLRYAIERFPVEERRRLLLATKPKAKPAAGR